MINLDIKAVTLEWCRRNHASIAEGGVWGVPQSTLIFKKTAKGYELLAVMPYLPDISDAFSHGHDVPPSPSALKEFQRQEFKLHREVHEMAGLTITDPKGLLT